MNACRANKLQFIRFKFPTPYWGVVHEQQIVEKMELTVKSFRPLIGEWFMNMVYGNIWRTSDKFPTPYWGVVHEPSGTLSQETIRELFPTPYWGVVHEPCRLYPLV